MRRLMQEYSLSCGGAASCVASTKGDSGFCEAMEVGVDADFETALEIGRI